MIINRNKIDSSKLLSLIILVFLYGKYFVSFISAYNVLFIRYQLIFNFFTVLMFAISVVTIKYDTNKLLIIILSILAAVMYQTVENFSLMFIINIFIAIKLMELYILNKEKITKLFFISGILYIATLFYLLLSTDKLMHFMSKAIWGRNYISSVLFVFVLFSLFLKERKYKWFSLFGFSLLLILKSRTAIFSLLILVILKFWKNKSFYIITLIGIFIINYSLGIKNIVFKWGYANSIGSGRFVPWIYYLEKVFSYFPGSLLPYFSYNSSRPSNRVYDFISTTGYHPPHNLFIDLIYRTGIIGGLFFMFLLTLPLLFKSDKNKNERLAYFSLLIYAMLEPSIDIGTNLITLVFLIMLYFLYSNANLVHDNF